LPEQAPWRDLRAAQHGLRGQAAGADQIARSAERAAGYRIVTGRR
jgi:hypothetical protein